MPDRTSWRDCSNVFFARHLAGWFAHTDLDKKSSCALFRFKLGFWFNGQFFLSLVVASTIENWKLVVCLCLTQHPFQTTHAPDFSSLWSLNTVFFGGVSLWACLKLGLAPPKWPSKGYEFPNTPEHHMIGIIWVCLKMGYIPNYSHLIGIMIIDHWV